jgi:hypothetical protein
MSEQTQRWPPLDVRVQLAEEDVGLMALARVYNYFQRRREQAASKIKSIIDCPEPRYPLENEPNEYNEVRECQLFVNEYVRTNFDIAAYERYKKMKETTK